MADSSLDNAPEYDPQVQAYIIKALSTPRTWPLWKKNKREKRRAKHTWHCSQCGASWSGLGMHHNALKHQELTGHLVYQGNHKPR